MGIEPVFHIFEDDIAFWLVEHFMKQPVEDLQSLIFGVGLVIKHLGTGGINKDVIASLNDNNKQRNLACSCCDLPFQDG